MECTDARRMTNKEFAEQVRVNLVRYLEANRWLDVSGVAAQTGYSRTAIHKFRSGQIVTFPVATRLVECYPELGRDTCCPCCGRRL